MVRTCMFCDAEELGKDLTYHRMQNGYATWVWAEILCLRRTPCYLPIILKKKCFQEGTAKGCLLHGSISTIFGQYNSDCVFGHARKGQDKNRSFRKTNNAELLQKWITAMAAKDFVPNKGSVLCSEHFEKDCFRKTGRNACTLTQGLTWVWKIKSFKKSVILLFCELH